MPKEKPIAYFVLHSIHGGPVEILAVGNVSLLSVIFKHIRNQLDQSDSDYVLDRLHLQRDHTW